MTTTTIGRGTGSGGVLAAKGVRRPWARRLWAWLTDTSYRPERHYMRGGRQGGTVSARPHPA